ncbi:Glutathione-dependent formaldehyde-activating enzyme/centromere protein V [Penicillium alfredii]|uniref:Glutathione-dependent formaldehyde-activating enzyme/centromere protein V n=1 Tax=Penicillium alfredii TaxID=1506179 RepID=A0A9W9F0J4_9EURO|nr:Glutathione-dependent formaldehyde-activating enzyme/centromere protein V [Penicillium alfredii]KAJ5091255.1 Glutathione-dependent formaldehyde-activating enzyme/centromere protein V [Penicillium alfredii]
MVYEPLHGSCSCGRNNYQITIPDDVTDHAEVYFDSSRDNRRFHGTPLTAWLRVPLDWYQSSTHSFFPDETHSSIRRSFTPRHAPHTRRIFCGFCGTPLTFWTEEPREEAEYMSVAIGSLFGENQRELEDLGLLPEDFEDETPHTGISTSSALASSSRSQSSSVIVPSFGDTPNLSRSFRRGTAGGIPWFEEMVEGSRLGRLMRAKRGRGISDDQSTSIEWEISEWHDDGTGGILQEDSESNGHATGKRKRGHHGDAEAASPNKRTE